MNFPKCTCPIIDIGEVREPCPLHEGFSLDGVFYKRCGDSDATGGPYYIGAPLIIESPLIVESRQ
jgi:hypothetical protein